MTARACAGSADADGAAARRRPSPEALADVVASVLLLALFAWAFVAAGEWSYRAALFPRLVTAAGIVLTALHLAQVLLRIRRPVPPGADDEPDGDPHDVEYVFRTAGPRRWAAALGWVAAFFALLHVVGLYPTAAIFPLLYLRFAGGRTWIFSAIYAIVSAVVLYVSFELALGVPTPTGLLLD